MALIPPVCLLGDSGTALICPLAFGVWFSAFSRGQNLMDPLGEIRPLSHMNVLVYLSTL